jgi:hypothetical protein
MPSCPNSDCVNHTAKGSHWYVKYGYYKPKGSGQRTARFKCKECGKLFSSNTHKATAYQKKRSINGRLFELLVSGVSLRRAAELLEVEYNTVLLHFDYLADAAQKEHTKFLLTFKTEYVQVDELKTFVHARPKCVSVPMAVRVKTGQILGGFDIARMPAKGKLADIGVSKYAWTTDERSAKFQGMLNSFVGCLKPSVTFKCDSNPNFKKWITAVVPHAKLEQVIGKTKKQPAGTPKDYDELTINNTFARMRHDMNRLARKTWSTSKAIHGLEKHLWLYVAWNNSYALR